MSTAEIIYEQYKVLPPKVKNELIALINKENDAYLEVALPEFVEGLSELKQALNGKLKARPISELLMELGHA